MIRRVNATESQIQCAIVEWSTKIFVDHPNGGKVLLRPYLIKITNEGKQKTVRNKKGKIYCPTGIRYNKEGRVKGASDLFLAFPVYRVVGQCGRGCCGTQEEYLGFWYEVKAPGKRPTHEQLEFLAGMKGIGYGVGWGDSVDKGIQDFKDYLGIK